MIKKLSRAALLMAGTLGVAGCTLGQGSTAQAPAAKPAAADYQAPVPPAPPPTNIRGYCYNPQDLADYRVRMVQMELNVATLQCQLSNGTRAYETTYAAFIQKYQSELTGNTQALQSMARRKRFNIDVVVTEFANRTAQHVQVDKEFCARSKRAFDWAMSPQVTSLKQVPPPYDLGPDMNVWPCPAP
jgi:hypothetical protein